MIKSKIVLKETEIKLTTNVSGGLYKEAIDCLNTCGIESEDIEVIIKVKDFK